MGPIQRKVLADVCLSASLEAGFRRPSEVSAAERLVDNGLLRHAGWTGKLAYFEVTPAGIDAWDLIKGRIERGEL